MLANDLEPNRLIRAKLAAQDLIEALPSDRIGLIAFAGSCFLQAPLTIDHEAVIETIQQLDTDVIPRGGTNISRAITLAAETFLKSGTTNNAVVLFSDGEDLEGDTDRKAALTRAREAKMTIVTVGVGTIAGSIVPDPNSRDGSEFIRDREGSIVRSRLDDSLLRRLAVASGGLYLNLNSTNTTRDIIGRAIDRIERGEIESQAIDLPIDRYRWPLVMAILTFVGSILPWSTPSIRGDTSRIPTKPMTGLFLLGLTASPALALSSPGDEALDEFNSGEFEAAMATYDEAIQDAWLEGTRARLNFGRGAAAYKLGDFREAAQSFGEALRLGNKQLQEDAHYNLGNSLYREGEALADSPTDALLHWRDAATHFESALALNQENQEAAHNLEVVNERIEELEQQQQQQQQQEDQDGPRSEEQPGDESGEDGSESNRSEPTAEGQSSSNQDQEEPDSGQNTGASQPEGQEGPERNDQEESTEIPEGEISTNGEDERTTDAQERNQATSASEDQAHPETGYTPSEARAILRRYSGEDLDVKPLVPRNYEPVKQDW